MCVRFVHMRGIDLAQFQFDYDLTWAAIFLHPDGTVLARYGSRSEAGPMALNSLEGLMATMNRVVDAFARYPANKALFAAKRGPKPRFARAELIPGRATRHEGPVGRKNCIHCHNVYDALRDLDVERGTYDPLDQLKYPLPESAGLVVDPVSGTRIVKVLSRSAAAAAGLEAGDTLVSLGGQAILSLADIQFVLHFLGKEATVEAVVARDGTTLKRTLSLSGPWRLGNLSWRESMYGMPPRPGLWIGEVSEDVRPELGIAPGKLALRVRGVFGKAVRKAGLRKGDVIVAYDGRSGQATAGQFHTYLRLHHYRPGSRLELEVLRKGKRKRIAVTF